MTLALMAPGPHAEDGALVRLLDRETTATEQAHLVMHLETCERCRARKDALAELSREVSLALARSDEAPRAFTRARRGRISPAVWRWWPAAAAVVLLLGGTMAVAAAPVRTWIVARWTGLRETLHLPKSGPAQTPARDQLQAGMVSFVPETDVLTVRIASRQAEGSLVLEGSTAATASVTVRGQGEHEAVVVLPDELRIANTGASRATYRVTLPTRLKQVVVVVGQDRPVVSAPVPPGDSMVIDLGAHARR